jgi:hypothetical protein
MPRRLFPRLLGAVVVMLAPACGDHAPTQPTDMLIAEPAATLDPSSMALTAAAGVMPEAVSELPEFDPRNFVHVVDHPFFPLGPGTRYTFEGFDGDEPLRDIIDVTREDKEILGVKVVVVLDRVFISGELAERTLDYFAQDKDGNVWYLGEDTKEFENGKVVSTEGSFEAGKNGAKAGIIMRAHPKVGETTQQEVAPGVAEDRATVVALDATVTTPYRTFHNCIKTRDFTPLEPGALEVKFYCRGVGVARGRDVSGGSVRLWLTRVDRCGVSRARTTTAARRSRVPGSPWRATRPCRT